MNHRRGAEASVRSSPELRLQLEDSDRRRRKVLTIQDYSFGCLLLYLLFLDCCFPRLPNLWKLSEIWAGSTLRILFVSKEERRILQKICVFFLQKCEELENCC
jgi:hypothetical protein